MGRAADRLGRVGQNLRLLPDEAVRSGNRRVRARVVAALKEDVGSDRTLSGLGRYAKPQTVRTTKRSKGNLVEGRIMAGPARQRAPWFWLEEGTVAGRRGPAVGRFNARKKPRGIHPGTPPLRTWSRAVGQALPEVRAEIDELYRKAMTR